MLLSEDEEDVEECNMELKKKILILCKSIMWTAALK